MPEARQLRYSQYPDDIDDHIDHHKDVKKVQSKKGGKYNKSGRKSPKSKLEETMHPHVKHNVDMKNEIQELNCLKYPESFHNYIEKSKNYSQIDPMKSWADCSTSSSGTDDSYNMTTVTSLYADANSYKRKNNKFSKKVKGPMILKKQSNQKSATNKKLATSSAEVGMPQNDGMQTNIQKSTIYDSNKLKYNSYKNDKKKGKDLGKNKSVEQVKTSNSKKAVKKNVSKVSLRGSKMAPTISQGISNEDTHSAQATSEVPQNSLTVQKDTKSDNLDENSSTDDEVFCFSSVAYALNEEVIAGMDRILNTNKKEEKQPRSDSKKASKMINRTKETKVGMQQPGEKQNKSKAANKAFKKAYAVNKEVTAGMDQILITNKKGDKQFRPESKKASKMINRTKGTKVGMKQHEEKQNKSKVVNETFKKKKGESFNEGVNAKPEGANSKKVKSRTNTRNKGVESRRDPNAPLFTFAEHLSNSEVLLRYHQRDPKLIRGRLHIAQGIGLNVPAYVSCDRGSLSRDVRIRNYIDRNRAMDGDYVYVELLSNNEEAMAVAVEQVSADMDDSSSSESDNDDCDSATCSVSWKDDDMQLKLWNPAVDIGNVKMKHDFLKNDEKHKTRNDDEPKGKRMSGRIVHVIPPSTQDNIVSGSDLMASKPDRKSLIGRIKRKNNRVYLHPKSKYLADFLISGADLSLVNDESPTTMYFAEYVYGSWKKENFHPPCCNVKNLGQSCNPANETLALLFEYGLDHGDFTPDVLRDVDEAVKTGMNLPQTQNKKEAHSSDLEWKPSPEMFRNRRDYRNTRIFTIDPTDAKDLDDALHITLLDGEKVEIGVHIADVSHFVKSETALDAEAENRATTVYLVNQTVPMLPRPLCEIACSLNENVERLAFSCVWQMNIDGTLCRDKFGEEQVWYGKTVIKSCARLDYDTAQNIIDGKVANGEKEISNDLWPESRRPSDIHTVQDVANDVRLLNKVAMSRRKLRFENGALAFGRIKLRFKFKENGSKQKKWESRRNSIPFLCEPYLMKDSNRLVEEYMLMANYLVAQRIIMHAKDLAVLRRHPPPDKGLSEVIEAAHTIGFHIDATSSQTLHQSLCNFSRDCKDDILVQCITEMLSLPMKPAKYFATGCVDKEDWGHFALNIPYYTHFTSPIRRYPDILVHRLLQATIEGKKSVSKFSKTKEELHESAKHCNSKRKAAKGAQEQSDRIFLSLYLKQYPIQRSLAVVIQVKASEFIVFVPELGIRQIVGKVDNPHLNFTHLKEQDCIVLKPKTKEFDWDVLKIEMFTKLSVSCFFKPNSPSPDVGLKVSGPWVEQ